MTRQSPSPPSVRRPLAAGLVAAHLALGLAGAAFAQAADDQKVAEDQFRTQSANDPSTTSGDPNAAETSDDTELADAPAEKTIDRSGIDSPITDLTDPLDQEALQELRRQNLRENAVDGLKATADGTRNDAQGIRVGSFVLRPSITETLGAEREINGKDSTTRYYLRSGLKASATSDWSLHQLKIDAEGTWDKTFSGQPEDDPEGKIEAELRLDLTDEMTGTLKAGYSLEREDISDPNAIANATTQSDVETYSASAAITRDLGVLRTTAGLEFNRYVYSAAVLDNGDLLSQADRDRNTGILRGRLGYELSPALIPFIEAAYGQTIYDQHKDSLGFVRDATIYAAKAGVELDLGEKFKGELAGGYTIAEFDDAALKSISAATIDGTAIWSPHRGTDLALNLKTELEPSSTPGASGDVAYSATAILSQIILQNLTGQISSGITLRDYEEQNTARQSVVTLGTGLTWGISRSLDLVTDVSWESTRQDNVDDIDIFRAGIGLTLKR
jgi:hypothetical protein